MRTFLSVIVACLFCLTGCSADKQEKVVKPPEPQPLRFSVLDDTGQLVEVFRVNPNGDLFHRGKQITSDDRIIAAFYDLALSTDNTLSRCLSKLSLYRQEQVSGLMKRVVAAEDKALTAEPKKPEKAKKALPKKEPVKEK